MKKTIIIILIINIIAKLLGFGREMSQSYYFGASYISDAYIVSLSIPGIVLGIFGEGILSGYIPMYNHIKGKDGIERAKSFTINFINFTLIFAFFIFLIGMFLAPLLVRIFSYGFDERTFKMAVFFTRLVMISIFFLMSSNIISGFLQVNNRFYIVAFQGVPLNIIYILGNYFGYKYGNIYLTIFANFALISQFLILLPSAKKVGFKYKIKIDFKDNYLKEIIKISIPVILGTSIEQLNLLVDRTIASRLAEGSISILNYSGRLNSSIYGLSIAVVLGIMFPEISSLVSERKFVELKIKVINMINIIFIFTIPIIVIVILLSSDLVLVLFGRGKFNMNDVLITSETLRFYSLSLFGLCLRNLLTKIFYSYKDTKRPVVNSGIGIVFNIILSLIFSKYLGTSGIALATSLATTLITILLARDLLKNYGNFMDKSNYIVFIKVLLATFFMGIIVALIKYYVDDIYFRIIISGMIGILVYYIFLLTLRVKEVVKITYVIITKIKIVVK